MCVKSKNYSIFLCFISLSSIFISYTFFLFYSSIPNTSIVFLYGNTKLNVVFTSSRYLLMSVMCKLSFSSLHFCSIGVGKARTMHGQIKKVKFSSTNFLVQFNNRNKSNFKNHGKAVPKDNISVAHERQKVK